MGEVFGHNLDQINSKGCEKSFKKLALSIGFFHILQGEHFLKHKVVVLQTPELKFKANIARNATFEQC